MRHFRIDFPESEWPALEVPEGTCLSEILTASNSPILFGCRTGLCGTCLVRVENCDEALLAPPTAGEREILELFAQSEPQARLACQIHVASPLALTQLDEEP